MPGPKSNESRARVLFGFVGSGDAHHESLRQRPPRAWVRVVESGACTTFLPPSPRRSKTHGPTGQLLFTHKERFVAERSAGFWLLSKTVRFRRIVGQETAPVVDLLRDGGCSLTRGALASSPTNDGVLDHVYTHAVWTTRARAGFCRKQGEWQLAMRLHCLPIHLYADGKLRRR